MFARKIATPFLTLLLLTVLAAATLVFSGCGGSVAPTPIAATPAPTPSPSPTPTPTPTPVPGNNPEKFQVSMLQGDGFIGGIQVNSTTNDGSGSLTLKGSKITGSMMLRFCPFSPDPYNKGLTPCYDIAPFTTDGSGNAQLTFHFPKSGKFFGAFRVEQGTTDVADSGYTYTSTPNYHADIQTFAGTSDVDWAAFSKGSDPLGSGHVDLTGSMLSVVVSGAVANATYGLVLCPNVSGSGCYAAGSFNTDANGAANATIDLNKEVGSYTPGGETFYVFRGSSLQYVVGFKVN